MIRIARTTATFMIDTIFWDTARTLRSVLMSYPISSATHMFYDIFSESLCEDIFMDFYELFFRSSFGRLRAQGYLKLAVYKLVYFMQFLYICELSAP